MINYTVLSGRIARPLELKEINTQKGKTSVLDVCLATDGKTKEESNFFECVAFGSTAEFIANFSKGKGGQIVLGGRLTQDHYITKEGVKRTNTKIQVNDVQIIDWKERETQQAPKPQVQQQAPQTQFEAYKQAVGGGRIEQVKQDNIDINEEDLPF